jgi:protein-tyrosine phosphatase
MAGCFPGHGDLRIAERQLRALLDCGIRCFLSLMEEEVRAPFLPYEPLLERIAAERGIGVECLRFEIEDHSAPSCEQMREIERAIAGSIAAGRPVYLHCWGGRGRTGTVAGVYLVRRGLATTDGFVDTIAALRSGAPGESPETEEQIEFVRSFFAGSDDDPA